MKRICSIYAVILLFLLVGIGLAFAQVTEEWVKRYNGPGNSSDCVYAMVVDSSGHVYITGESYGDGTDLDYATVKYDSNGVVQWLERYDRNNKANWGKAIAVDSSGNVYVTGQSYTWPNYDYATIKYDSNGVVQWEETYLGFGGWGADFVNAIAVDSLGNVYVTGASYGGAAVQNDFATVKYNSGGVEQWVARYNGPANSSDTAWAIAVDGADNVYVTGGSPGIVTDQDYATVKYAAGVTPDISGNVNPEWVARYDGPGVDVDMVRAIALDDSGNIYITGESYGDGTDLDYATVKYAPDGTQLWVRRYNGPGNDSDKANAIALDDSANVYVTGASYGGAAVQNDFATVKYNSGGVEQWVARYNGPANSSDTAWAIAVDDSGNVYVAGESWGSGTSNDYATVKYDTNGQELWVERYNGPANSEDIAHAIAVDDSGNVYVAGESWGSGTSNDYATVKYSQVQNVTIDIKPGSDPNSINLGSQGVIPVAILSSADFDATRVDPTTVELAGSEVAIRGKGKSLAHQEDVNGDGLTDLVVQVETENLDPDTFQDGYAILTGKTHEGKQIEGRDEITIVPPDLAPADSPDFGALEAFPDPGNPDVWLPYKLGRDVDVTINIYSMNGRLIRTLDLGHQAAGYYVTEDKAAYWDGKNEVGEQVASGIYFYTIQAGDFAVTKKMVIAK